MAWQFTPLLLPQAIGALVSFVGAFLIWRRRSRAPGARALAAVQLAAGFWATAGALEFASTTLPAKIFWSQLSYLGIAACPLALLHFTYPFVRDGAPLPRSLAGFAFACSLILPLAAFTNGWHHLLWREVQLVPRGDFINGLYLRGPFFWFTVAYCYGVMFGCALALLRHSVNLVIALTADLTPEAAARWTAAGVPRILGKPLRLPVLSSVLHAELPHPNP
jgi:hypothetical protein